ncbi:APC family permease [Silvibacterium sp.]|uniref:APC family permease n=1 Tax=Silvibacterium sp. TaxID=1964179 RepID=UPI0039E71EAA
MPELLDETRPGYGLRRHVLGPWETLAQSVSAIAPTATPAMTIPLVFALAGNATWLVYLTATTALVLVGLVIGCFGRRSASPGSLFSYVSQSLPPWVAGIAGWALLLAYIATASSVAAGFFNFANVLLHAALGLSAPPVLLMTVAVVLAGFMAWRDIKLSAEMMLWMEGASVTCIVLILAVVAYRHGLHLDWPQLHLAGATGSGFRLGLVLALFSFVGFESATALGEEAREPLRTIPRAVLQCAIGCGAFFILCIYAEVLGYRDMGQPLDQAAAPLHVLAVHAKVGLLGTLVDIGAMISMFACVLACITAASRVLMLMSHHGLAHRALSRTHAKNETPHWAVLVTALATLVPAVVLALRGVSADNIYGWMGSLATYGFITVYALVCIALPVHLGRQQKRGKDKLTPGIVVLSAAGVLAMLLALAGTLYPVPAAPYNWLPYLYLGYLLLGLGWQTLKGSGLRAQSSGG